MCSNPRCKKEPVKLRKGRQLFCEDCLQMPFERRLKIAIKFLKDPKGLVKLNSNKVK